MAMNSLHDVLVHEVKDLHSAERQLIKALPKMAKGANSESLKTAFEDHLGQTEEQLARLEQVLELLEANGRIPKCLGMEGLIKEGAKVLEEDGEESVLDAALIAAAQRVEHYEIAAYGMAVAIARMLGQDKVAKLLERSLTEEKETDQKLTELAESEVNVAAE